MPEKKVQCPHCSEIFKLALPAVSADQLTRSDIEDILGKAQIPGNLDHQHKTADEFLDCPECRLWVDKTALRYQVTDKEPPGEKQDPVKNKEKTDDKELEPTTAVGSIFEPGGEHGQE